VVEEELVSNPSVYMAKLQQRDAAQAQLEAKIDAIASENSSSKEALAKQLSDIEKKLKGEILNAGADANALRSQFMALEDAVRNSNGKSNEELRKKLALFEASLRGLANKPGQIAVVQPAGAVEEIEDTSVTVGVTRGMKRDSYQVPSEELAN
jgi:chromosome segregation ATPase